MRFIYLDVFLKVFIFFINFGFMFKLKLSFNIFLESLLNVILSFLFIM